jgi:hypothetical protein
MATNMVVLGKLGECALQLFPGQVQGIIVNSLPRVFQSLEKQVHLAEVSKRRQVRAGGKGDDGWYETYPLPSSMSMEPSGISSAISAAEDSRTSIS